MQYRFLLAGLLILAAIPFSESSLLPAAELYPQNISFHFARQATPFWEQGKPKDISTDTAALKLSNWYALAMKGIEEMEYEIKYDEATKSYASPNRKNNLRSFYTANTFTLLPRNDSIDKWELELKTLGVFVNNKLVYSPAQDAGVSLHQKTIRFNNENNFITEYINSPEGVRQNFIINKEPEISSRLRRDKPQILNLKLQTNNGWYVNKAHDKELHFAKATKTGYDKKITYNSLKVWDANNKELQASFSVQKNIVSIDVNIAGAVYPVTIDPLSTGTLGTPDWIGDDCDQANANFGVSVASAGDVNGDGYSDVIIGAYSYDDGGNTDEGRAFVYHGSATGLSLTPNSTPDDADQAGAEFGTSVASAGDVNGDGYSDVIIGASSYDDAGNTNEGRAFVYHGSATGLSLTPNSTPDDADQINAIFGNSVSSAGDVNGDGYSDVIIGCWGYDDGGNAEEGRAFVYYGSAVGLSATPNSTPDDADQANSLFGTSVSSAGDVNGDGFSDVIIGARTYDDGGNMDEGRAFVYYGSVTGLSASPDSILDDADQAFSNFGISVACAGDINGDGYSDILIGARDYDDGGNIDEGRVFVYHGSASGLSATPDNTPDDADQANAFFGVSVACAGDVNGDGFSDVIIGAITYDDGPNTNEGRAFVYFGSASGLSATPSSTPDDADHAFAQFGISVASAGDVNGDGYSDVIVGAPNYDNGNPNEGAAFVYHGNPSGLSITLQAQLENNQISQTGYSVASAGDVNADGYSDVIVGARYFTNGQTNEGAAFVYHGSATGLNSTIQSTLEINVANAFFGSSVASAGDVNGDGYSDVIVSAPQATPGGCAAYVFHGSAAGVVNAVQTQLTNVFGAWIINLDVASAGDVNGDGYSDVILGEFYFTNGQSQEGGAFVYHGSATGITTTIQTQLEINQAGAHFGLSVAGAGDVNGDGYSDVIVGANWFDNGQSDEGAAFVYHGSAAGITTTVKAQLEGNQVLAQMGQCVSSAGDVNGDGYSDVIVGAINLGAAFIFHGNTTGINTTRQAQLENGQSSTQMGISVSSAGDVNGDGYSDVIVGANFFVNGQTDEGAAFLFHGSPAGIGTTIQTQLEGNLNYANMGYSVAGAGDVNGDGYSDVIVGAYLYNNGLGGQGASFVFLGNNGGGKRNNLRLYNTDLVTPIQHFNVTEPNLFGTGLFAKSPLGKVKGKLVWEVKSESGKFSGNPITNSTAFLGKQPSFTDLGIAGTELKYNVQKVGSKTNKVRVRVEYDKVTAITGQVYGPWRYPAGYTMGAYGMFSIPLPITLISFNGQFINSSDVQLSWITTNEINMQSYFIERSSDGINFATIGELNAKGIGSNRSDYMHSDKNVQHDILYYRLRLKEKSGEISYTKTITVSRNKLVRNFIAPNPVQQGSDAVLVLQSAVDKNNIHINIFNSSGQLVFKTNEILQAGKNEITLSTNKLAKGIYVVNVLGDGVKESYRLVVR